MNNEYVTFYEFVQYQKAMSVQLRLFRDSYLKTLEEVKELQTKVTSLQILLEEKEKSSL